MIPQKSPARASPSDSTDDANYRSEPAIPYKLMKASSASISCINLREKPSETQINRAKQEPSVERRELTLSCLLKICQVPRPNAIAPGTKSSHLDHLDPFSLPTTKCASTTKPSKQITSSTQQSQTKSRRARIHTHLEPEKRSRRRRRRRSEMTPETATAPAIGGRNAGREAKRRRWRRLLRGGACSRELWKWRKMAPPFQASHRRPKFIASGTSTSTPENSPTQERSRSWATQRGFAGVF